MQRRRLGPQTASKATSNASEDKALAVSMDGDLATEHALESSWGFWGRGQRPSERGAVAWESERLHEIQTAEAFWRLHGALQAPSSLVSGANYQLFRRSVKPTWEDAANAAGGEWTLGLPNRCAGLDEYWLKLCLAVIGGALVPDGDDADLDEVCGISLSVRKGGVLRLNLWTKNKSDADAQNAIGKKIRELLQLPSDITLSYTAHDKADALYEA